MLQVLYQDDLNPERNLAQADQFLQNRLLQNAELVEFARSLVSGVRRNRPELDKLLAERADNWSLARMAVTDRNILRLGAFELMYTDTPLAVPHPRAPVSQIVQPSRTKSVSGPRFELA